MSEFSPGGDGTSNRPFLSTEKGGDSGGKNEDDKKIPKIEADILSDDEKKNFFPDKEVITVGAESFDPVKRLKPDIEILTPEEFETEMKKKEEERKQEDRNVRENDDKQAGERYNSDMGKENSFNNGGSGNSGNGGGRGPENNGEKRNVFAERFSKTAESKIEADKLRNVHDNAVDLVKNNVDFFGGSDDEKKSEIALRVLGRYGRGYKSVQDILNDTNSNKNPRIAYGDLDSLAESVQIAMDMSVLGGDLVTDSMTAEQIDENLPVEMRGIGKRIKEKGLLDSIKTTLVEKNNVIENGNLFTTQDKVKRGEVCEEWSEEAKKLPENSYVRKYVEVATSVFEDLGVEKGVSKDSAVVASSVEKSGKEIRKDIDKLREQVVERLRARNGGKDYVNKYKNDEKKAKGSYDENGDFILAPPGEGDEDGKSEYRFSYQISADKAAEMMKYMMDARWDSGRPPEWFLELSDADQYKVEIMIAMNEVCSGVLYAGKDLEKILGNRSNFGFDHEQMNALFDRDFSLVMSKMLNELTEEYTDQNGIKALRYKEKFYKLKITDEDKKAGYDKFYYKSGKDGFIYDKRTDKRVEIEDNEYNRKKKIGCRTIDKDVMEKLVDIKSYKESLVEFSAKINGRNKANWMDKMNGYTAWNVVFGMGDTSVWDRMRILPTYTGIISDAIRTLNPEYKALAKWQILKGGKTKEDENLFDAEYFSGPLADWVISVMKMERDLAIPKKTGIKDAYGDEIIEYQENPIDGRKTLREKITDREMTILDYRFIYGFLDSTYQGRDLNPFKGWQKTTDYNLANESKRNLGQILRNMAEFDKDGNLVKENIVFNPDEKKGEVFNLFDTGQVSFMNEFRDALEGAITAYTYVMGKADMKKDPDVWARTIKDKTGMLNGIEFAGKRAYNYTRDPKFWRDVLVASYGADMSKISTDFICINNPPLNKEGGKSSYNLHIYDTLEKLDLINRDYNPQEIMRLLGSQVYGNETGNEFFVTLRNDRFETKLTRATNKLTLERNKNVSKFANNDFGMPKFIEEAQREVREFVNNFENKTNSDFKRLVGDFYNSIKGGYKPQIEGLRRAILEYQPMSVGNL